MAEVREKPSADAAANAQTAYSLSAGDTFNGVFDGKQDNDWVRVELVEGTTYEIHLAGAGDNRGGAGNDTLLGFGGQDFLIGNRGDDTLEGGDDDDLLLGDDANPLQRIFFRLFPDGMPVVDDGSRGIDSLADPDDSGAAASDSNLNAAAGAGEPGSTEQGVIDGVDRVDDTLFPMLLPDLTRADVLAYLDDRLHAGNDVLRGGPGNDWLEGGAGNDELFGGDDDDLLVGDSSSAAGFGAPLLFALDDGMSLDSALAMSDGLEGERALDNLALMLIIDELTGGDDMLEGGPGNDTLIGGNGNDTLSGGTGADLLDGGEGHDELDGGPGDDYLHGGAGADRLAGGTGSDWLEGGTGSDVLEGGDGNDILVGDHFAAFLILEPAGDEPVAVEADGQIIADDPGDIAVASFPVYGGDDTLSGGAGDDLLDGGYGNDELSGGPGADIFVFAHDSGHDIVTDFRIDEDSIDLSALAGIDAMDDLTLLQQGDDLVIDLLEHGGSQVTLQDVNQTDLADTHFIFFIDPEPLDAA